MKTRKSGGDHNNIDCHSNESSSNPEKNQSACSYRSTTKKPFKKKHITKSKAKNSDINRQSKICTTKSILNGNTEPPVSYIPENKFKEALHLIKTTITSKCSINQKELECLPPIHEMEERKYEITRDVNVKFVLEARKCLLKRDWNSLARILSVAHPVTTAHASQFFSTYAKYAMICLYHNQDYSDLLLSFLSGVILTNETPNDFIKLLTRISKM